MDLALRGDPDDVTLRKSEVVHRLHVALRHSQARSRLKDSVHDTKNSEAILEDVIDELIEYDPNLDPTGHFTM